jgi:class 3 adenylate cyclase
VPDAGGAASADPREERRIVSVLFCDLAGFTHLAETADAEDVQRMLSAYHDAVRERVVAYGGWVGKLLGDGVLALFGVPTAREDDAERAVRAALGVVDAVASLSLDEAALRLPVRVGVSTGEVIVTFDHAGADPEVSGDAVNTAARLQEAAEPDTVVVGSTTYKATALVFDYVDLGQVSVKGKADPVPVHRPTAARMPYGAEVYLDLTVPLVGRDLELRQLQTAFDLVVRQQTTHLVTLLGAPGVGKSRMVAELLASVPTDVTCRLGRVPPFGESTGFSALAEIVKAHAGVYDSDSAVDAADKLMRALEGLPEREWVVSRLLSLLGAEPSLLASRAEVLAAWRTFLAHIASSGPAVVVVEDVHQADDGLLSFLSGLAAEEPAVALLLVVTARPQLLDLEPEWGGGLRNATLVNIGPLNTEETRELLRSHLKGVPIPAEGEDAIIAKAGGNPLFAGEFVRMLRDSDLVERVSNHDATPGVDIVLPETVRGVIAARLDLVEGVERSVLHDAAVFGRVFWTGAVAAVGGRDVAEVDAALHRLTVLEIVQPVRRSSMAGEREHTFTHALIREAAYGQLMKPSRARRHLAAAAWLERRVGVGTDELVEDLAYHARSALDIVTSSGDEEQTADIRRRLVGYYRQAADVAQAVGATAKELAHIHAACLLAESFPPEPLVASLVARRAWLRWEMGDTEGACQDAVDAVAYAERLGQDVPDVQVVAPLARGEAWLDRPPDVPQQPVVPLQPQDIAVALGEEARRWELGRTTPTYRTSSTTWEVVVSVDRAFYGQGLVDLPLPGAARGRRVALVGARVMVGRGRDVVVNLEVDPVDRAVSRVHAVLARDRDGWTVTQVAEHNPTYLNGTDALPVGSPVRLAEGDYLNMGGWTRVTLRRSRT